MNICLIVPPRLLRPLSATMKPAPPLGLAFIAAALRDEGHNVQVIDCIAEASDKYYLFKNDVIFNGLTNEGVAALIHKDTDIIGFSVMFSGNWIHNRALIDFIGE